MHSMSEKVCDILLQYGVCVARIKMHSMSEKACDILLQYGPVPFPPLVHLANTRHLWALVTLYPCPSTNIGDFFFSADSR